MATLGKLGRTLAAAGLAAGTLLGAQAAQAADTIKVGILHSLSGTMAISETTLKDVMLMLIEEQNKKGGLLGKQITWVQADAKTDRVEGAKAGQQVLNAIYSR